MKPFVRAIASLTAVLCLGLIPAAAQADPAPVPCSPSSGGHYNCDFYPAGDGISGGAPVQASDSSVVGYLNQGTNWVICQRTGGTVTSGPYQNNWWAWTEANDGKWGWVNAVWAKGGDNFGAYQGVPACADSVGLPPGAQPAPASGASTVSAPPSSSPAPTPPPAAAPPAAGSGSSSPAGHSPAPAVRRHQRVRIALRWNENLGVTRVIGLSFHALPRHARVAAACRGHRCRFRTRAGGVSPLRRALLRQAFSPGEVLRLTITAPGYRPLVADLHFVANGPPVGRLIAS